MTIELRTDQIEMLIDEQRNLFKSGDFTKETCHFNMGYLKEKYNASVYRNKTCLNTRFLKQTKQCSICFENHDFNKLLKTDCGHYFGICCYSRWEETCQEDRVTCPYCRKLNPCKFLFAENNIGCRVIK
tara:strand:+ start:720 stop:1106 length:387 start_codon:yes stop_codon:yes gene_type:complete